MCSRAPGSRGRTQPELAGASSPAPRPAHVEGVGRMPAGHAGGWDAMSLLGCHWLSEGLLRDPALGGDGCSNGAIGVHPLINVVEE